MFKNFLKSWMFVFVCSFTVLFTVFIILSSTGAGRADFFRDVTGIVFTPFQKGASNALNFISDKVSYFSEYNNLKTENDKLKEQLRESQRTQRMLERYADENERLKEYLGIKENNPQLSFVAAETIAREPGNRFHSFTIDKGSLNGIKPRDAVITADGLVGYISEVGTTYSKVHSIISSGSVVGAIVSRTRDVAVLEGDLKLQEQGLCRLSMLSGEKAANVGDYVETSGLGGLYPKGLLIGKVLSVLPEQHGISYTAVIEPAVDFARVREVLVVTAFNEAGEDSQ